MIRRGRDKKRCNKCFRNDDYEFIKPHPKYKALSILYLGRNFERFRGGGGFLGALFGLSLFIYFISLLYLFGK